MGGIDDVFEHEVDRDGYFGRFVMGNWYLNRVYWMMRFKDFENDCGFEYLFIWEDGLGNEINLNRLD